MKVKNILPKILLIISMLTFVVSICMHIYTELEQIAKLLACLSASTLIGLTMWYEGYNTCLHDVIRGGQ